MKTLRSAKRFWHLCGQTLDLDPGTRSRVEKSANFLPTVPLGREGWGRQQKGRGGVPRRASCTEMGLSSPGTVQLGEFSWDGQPEVRRFIQGQGLSRGGGLNLAFKSRKTGVCFIHWPLGKNNLGALKTSSQHWLYTKCHKRKACGQQKLTKGVPPGLLPGRKSTPGKGGQSCLPSSSRHLHLATQKRQASPGETGSLKS